MVGLVGVVSSVVLGREMATRSSLILVPVFYCLILYITGPETSTIQAHLIYTVGIGELLYEYILVYSYTRTV